ncbi:CD59 glycoprotein-like [Sinocyclocheilus rhinocerous]|uniref:CD59 glycoprotein-like n=1 Tax=Sinocyclocheilus rhinocerous TaxID=307959 RepID=UPI0007B93901|nr:PREDICTED: CD59 glycoprotein-like [Sinocyclocheilus rhinocerous]
MNQLLSSGSASSQGSTLKCYNCVPGTPGGSCVATQETCGYKKDTCVSARFTIPPYSYFRRCISMADCMILQSSPNIKAKCCQTDLCNTNNPRKTTLLSLMKKKFIQVYY